MAGDEILRNKIDDAHRRIEDEEADAKKPYLAMLERERQINERKREAAAQEAAKIKARDEALFAISRSVKAMNPSFSEREIEVLRFLKAEFLAKGERPPTMLDTDKAIFNRDVMARFNMPHSEYVEMMNRFQALGIVDFNKVAMMIEAPNNGLLHVKPSIVEVVRQLDEEVLRKKAEPPNLLDESKKWALSKWWIVGPVILLLVVVWLINQIKPILEWFGVKR